MIKILVKNDHEAHFHTVPDFIEGSWINCEQATREDITEIAELIGLTYSDLSDSLDKQEIPRIERMGDIVVIYCRYPTLRTEFGMYTSTVTFVLTKSYFITISPTKNELLQDFILQNSRISSAAKTKCLLSILTKISQSYSAHIRKARAEVLVQGNEINNVSSDDVTDITVREEKLNQLMATLLPFKSVIECLSSGRFTVVMEEDQDLLEDLIHSINQSEEMAKTNLRMIRSLRNLYEVVFSTQLNKTMKLLTAMTIILNIPTMVSSLYGMNVSLPIEKSPSAFYFIIGFITVISLGAFYIFQKRKWL